MMEIPTTSATLLQRLQDGQDVEAWREFYDTYHELVLAVARRWGLQPTDCDDVVQETLAKLARAMPQFRYDPQRGRFRSYFKTAVTNVVMTKLRQDRRVGRVQTMDGEIDTQDPSDEIWETEWRRHHVRLAMRRVRSEFSERDLEVFDQYAVRGGSTRAISDALGVTPEQIYQIKSRVARRICALIEEQIHLED